MRYYTITLATHTSGTELKLDFTHVPEYSLQNQKEFWGRCGYKLTYNYAYSVSDNPVFRVPNDEERAAGVKDDFVRNER